MQSPLFRIATFVFQGIQSVGRWLDNRASGAGLATERAKALTEPAAWHNALRQRGAVLRSYENFGWVVNGNAEVAELLRDDRLTADVGSSPVMRAMVRAVLKENAYAVLERPHLLSSDPPDHTRVRKLLAQAFNRSVVTSLEPMIADTVDNLLEDVPTDAASFDLVAALAQPLPARVIARMLGVPPQDQHLFEAWSDDLVGITDMSDPDRMYQGGKAMAEMQNYIAELAEVRRAEPGTDLLSLMLAAEEAGDRLTMHELLANCVLLLVAGHETTTRLIGSTAWLLLTHPKVLEAARTSDEVLVAAIEETLRLEPPVLSTLRFAKERFDFHGRTFTKGQMILLSICAANRDPAAFEDPDRFDVTRDSGRNLGFGYGPHLCLGMTLARIEARVALRHLLDRFPRLRLVDERPHWAPEVMFRGLARLELQPGAADDQDAGEEHLEAAAAPVEAALERAAGQ